MFNDLNQTGQPAPQAPVDDIFAETDKNAEAKKFSGYYSNQTTPGVSNSSVEIETQRVGLSSAEDVPVSSKGKILKIVLIILLILLLLGLGYLVYAKFLTGAKTDNNLALTSTTTATTSVIKEESKITFGQDLTVNEVATETVPVSEEVVVIPSIPIATTTPPVSNLTDFDDDGLTDEEENILGTDINLKDTDTDGLSDYEEVKIYNTNPNKIDTDGDLLSDYEEVKIYKTDPLKVDTDGDTYSDGAEVQGGYNPLGTGKMTDVPK